MSIKGTQPRSILLYNPISGHGHLDSWNALFVGFLLNAGWRVAALSPDVVALRLRLAQKKLEAHPNLKILDWRPPKRSLFERIRGKLARILRVTVQSEPTEALRALEAHYLQPLEFAQRVRDAVTQMDDKPQIVFNMYMDLYRPDDLGWAPFAREQKIPWAGIRFVPSAVHDASTRAPIAPSEAYYRLPSLLGMCFLDELLCEQYAQRLPQKVFGYLPDITEASLSSTPSDLTLTIKHRAAGRKIVFLGGSIGGSKNLSHWYDLIAQAPLTDWFFVQIGEVHEQTLSAADRLAYEQIQKEPPENFLLKKEYLPDESEFNDVIAASDILFAVYRQFSVSSNMLGKAATFEKPIVVATGYLMGSRVEQYQIGLAVPEDDSAQTLKALSALAATSENRRVCCAEHFAAYRRDFSHDALQKRFITFLETATYPTPLARSKRS